MEEEKGVEIRKNLAELWKKEEILTSSIVNDAFIRVPREKFLPQKLRELAYTDEDIRLDSSSIMLSINTIITLLEEAKIEKNNIILQIGSVTGYEEALLTLMGAKVDVIEPRIEHIQRASANLGTIYPKNEAPQYYRRLRDTHKHYDRVITFGTISSMDEKIIGLVKKGTLVLSVGEKHLLMRMEIKETENPILKFHGIRWMPLIGDDIFS